MRRWALISLLILVTLAAATPVLAVTYPTADMGIIPQSRSYIDGYTPKYEDPGVAAYHLDGDYGMLDVGSHVWLSITNALLILNAILVKLAIRVMEWAFTMPLVTDMIELLEGALATMAAALWDSRIIHVAIVCAGIWAGWTGLVLRRTAQATGILVSTVVLVALAAWSFGGGLAWALRFVNDASTEVSGAVLASVSRVVAPEPDGLEWSASRAFVTAGDSIWTVFVVYPWAVAEFNGDLNTAQQYENRGIPGGHVLVLDSAKRQRFYQNLDEETQNRDFAWWQSQHIIKRLVIALLAFVVGVAFSLLLMVMAGAVLMFQVAAVLVAALAPIVFLAGLFWPGYGSYLVSRWAMRVLGFLVTKIVLAAILSLVLLLSVILYQVGSSYGWAAGALLQLVLVAAVVVKAKALYGFVSTLPSSPERAAQRLSEWHEPHVVQSGRLALAGAAGAVAWRAAGRIRELPARREAVATLNQRLAREQARSQKTGQPSLLVKRVERRMQQGARRPWTEAEIQAEMRRNAELRSIGADPRAIAAGGEDEGVYQSQVERVRRLNAQAEQRLRAMRATYGPRVRQQRWQRSPIGRAVSWVQSKVSRRAPGSPAPTTPSPSRSKPTRPQRPSASAPSLTGPAQPPTARPRRAAPVQQVQQVQHPRDLAGSRPPERPQEPPRLQQPERPRQQPPELTPPPSLSPDQAPPQVPRPAHVRLRGDLSRARRRTVRVRRSPGRRPPGGPEQ